MAQLGLVLVTVLLQIATARLTLEGQAVAFGTNTPVPRARIVVARVGGTVEDYRTGVADANGRFSFRDLAAGSYRVFAERQGFLRGEHGRRVASGAGTPVWLVAGQPTQITVTMIPTGVITGRVFDDGHPSRNVWVRAMRASFFDGQRTLAMAGYAKADDLGEYRLFGLAPGIYYVSAIPQDRARIQGDIYVQPQIPSNANGNRSSISTPVAEAMAKGLIEPAALDDGIFVQAFYPGTTDETTAAAIEVQPGGTVTGIDLTIARSRAMRVRGRVIDATTGRPPRNVSVGIGQPGGRPSSSGSAVVDAAGAFEMPPLPPGRYILSARSTTTDQRSFGTMAIELRDRDVENVDIVMRPGTALTGRASIVGLATGAAPPRISVQLLGIDGMPGYSATLIQPDGTFTVANVESREYRVRLVGPRGFLAPASVRFAGEDVTGRSFRFGPDVPNVPLEVVVSLAVGGLDVTVVDGNQRPAQGVTVALVPDAPRRNQSSLFRTASADDLGRLRFDDVIPGDYRLFTDDVDPSTWQDPEVLRRYENRGTRVRITEGARQAVTVRVR